MKVCVYTANFGKYDYCLAPKFINKDVDYYYFTDKETAKQVPEPWLPIVVSDISKNPQMVARELKTRYMPTLFDVTIWHDANLVLTDDPVALIEKLMGDSDIALFSHPSHVNITQEGMAIHLKKNIPAEEVKRQTEHYRRVGYTNDNGHYESGFMIRRTCQKIHHFNAVWWDHIQSFCIRDQMSIGYAMWRTGVKVSVLPGSCYHSPFIDAHRHAGVMNHDNSSNPISR